MARDSVVVLDHKAERRRDRLRLHLLDWPGNVPFGVYTPGNFLSPRQWTSMFDEVGVRVEAYDDRIRLYGEGLLERAFGGALHFTCRLPKDGASQPP